MIDTNELAKQVSAHGKRAGGREGRRVLRAKAVPSFPALVRDIPAYEIVPGEAIELIHDESCKILEEVGCDFRDDQAPAQWKRAGAMVDGYRVRIGRDLLMALISSIPSEYTMHARNPARTVKVGGKNTIFVPMYGAPYVRDLDNVRRYGQLTDLNNFHKLAYMEPTLHSSSSIICEPMDVAVPRRHLQIIYSALKYSDKPFMGIVTAKERAEDVMKMAGIVFGDDFVRDNTVLTSITNCNSPLVWDQTMLDAVRVYAQHNQPLILAPFALCGASTAASSVGAVAQVNAEALAGLAYTQLVRRGSPQLYGQFMVTVDMKTGAPMGGTPEAAQMMYLMGALARKYHLPWRTSGFHVGSKLNDAQAGYESNMLMHAAILSGANYIWHVAGWLEAGLCCGYSNSPPTPNSSAPGTNMPADSISPISRMRWRRCARSDPPAISWAPSTRSTISRTPSSCPASWTSTATSNGRPTVRSITIPAGATAPAPCSKPTRSPSSTPPWTRLCAISSPGANANCRSG